MTTTKRTISYVFIVFLVLCGVLSWVNFHYDLKKSAPLQFNQQSPTFTAIIDLPQAFADDNNMQNPELELDSDTGLSYFISKVNGYTNNTLPAQNTDAIKFNMFSYEKAGDDYVLYMNKKGYDQNETKIKQIILQQMYKTLTSSEMNSRDKNRIDNWIQSIDQANSAVVKSFSQDTETDLYAAHQVIEPFQSPLGTVLGVLAIVIALALTFSFVWDIAFLTIPLFTNLLSRGEVSKSSKPFLVSQDAVLAYNEGYDKGQSVLGVFLRIRMKTVVIIGLCLAYLISNQIWSLVAFIIDFFGRWLS